MHRIYFVTGNTPKVRAAREALSSYGVDVIHKKQHLPELQSDDLFFITKEKVLAAYKIFREPVLVNDAAFYIDCLNGYPWTMVKWMNRGLESRRVLRLLNESDERSCRFRECLAYYDTRLPEPVCFDSFTEGSLAKEPRGKFTESLHKSQLMEIFIPEGETKTVAEMTPDEFTDHRQRFRKRVKSYDLKFAEWYIENRKPELKTQ